MTTYLILITAAVVGTLVAAIFILLFKITGLKSYDPFTLFTRTLIYGDYPQTRLTLRDDHGFCCLGVGCDLHSKVFNIPWSITENAHSKYFYINDQSILPVDVTKWLGLTSSVGEYYDIKKDTGYTSLADFNDTANYTFKEIGKFAHNNRIKLTNLSYSDQYGN